MEATSRAHLRCRHAAVVGGLASAGWAWSRYWAQEMRELLPGRVDFPGSLGCQRPQPMNPHAAMPYLPTGRDRQSRGSIWKSWAEKGKGEPEDMKKLKKLLVLALSLAIISLGGAGCKGNGGHEHTEGDHPSSEHPSEEDSESEHPTSEHPTSEHPR